MRLGWLHRKQHLGYRLKQFPSPDIGDQAHAKAFFKNTLPLSNSGLRRGRSADARAYPTDILTYAAGRPRSESSMSEHLDILRPIIEDIVRPRANDIDQQGTFPAAALTALGESGLLGLLSAKEIGGMGLGTRQAAEVVETLARDCASTAMVVTMHYCGTVVIEAFAGDQIRRDVVSDQQIATVAFSEAGSRSHFWAPLSTATQGPKGIVLDAKKSWVTSANHADIYIWSSQPSGAADGCTLWLVPRGTAGIEAADGFDGLGLRGNDSTPCTATSALIAEDNRLGEDGGGFDIMIGVVLPLFNILSSACSIGIMAEATTRTCAHVTSTRHQHLATTLADLPTIRANLARMQCKVDQSRALMLAAIDAIDNSEENAMLLVLESKAACNDNAAKVCDLAMRVCGGAAFRKDLAIERYFRDARAGMVMAPTSDALYDFVGRALCGMELF